MRFNRWDKARGENSWRSDLVGQLEAQNAEPMNQSINGNILLHRTQQEAMDKFMQGETP